MATALDRIREAGRRVPAWAWALAFSVALCLPRLSHSGFWDPWELKLAEQARDVAASSNLFDPTAGGRYPGTRPLGTILSALGIRLFGASEIGARFFIALSALGALMAVYWAGAGLLRRRAAVLATLALGTMPLFVMEARQLTSDAPLIAALALALGGFGRLAWPPDGRRRGRDATLGLFGLAVGVYAGGLLVGALLPLAALFTTELLCLGLRPRDPVTSPPSDGTGPLSAAGIALAPTPPASELAPGSVSSPQAETGTLSPQRSYGASLLGSRTVLGVAWRLALLAALALTAVHLTPGRYSFALGGVPRSGPSTHTFEALVRQLGFGLFPWSAVAFFALARPLIRLDGEGVDTHPRLAFVELYFLLFAGFGFGVSSLVDVLTGDARYVALPAIALAIGAFIDEALEGNRPEPVAGLLMAIGTMVVARDFFLAPEELASVAIQEKVKWPPALSVGDLFLVVGFVAAAGVYGGLAARGRALGKVAPPDPPAPAVGGATSTSWCSTREFRPTSRRRRGRGVRVLPGAGSRAAAVDAFVVQAGARVVREVRPSPATRSASTGSRAMARASTASRPCSTSPQDSVVRFLRDPERVFATGLDDELAALDAGFKQAARALLRRRRLLVPVPAAHEPTRRRTARRQPARQECLDAAVGQQCEWRRGEAPLELARSTRRRRSPTPSSSWAPTSPTERAPARGRFPLDLIFRIKARPPGTYKIFVHFDGPAAPRVIGDHDPVNHAFGTSYWLPGEYIRDHYRHGRSRS